MIFSEIFDKLKIDFIIIFVSIFASLLAITFYNNPTIQGAELINAFLGLFFISFFSCFLVYVFLAIILEKLSNIYG